MVAYENATQSGPCAALTFCPILATAHSIAARLTPCRHMPTSGPLHLLLLLPGRQPFPVGLWVNPPTSLVLQRETGNIPNQSPPSLGTEGIRKHRRGLSKVKTVVLSLESFGSILDTSLLSDIHFTKSLSVAFLFIYLIVSFEDQKF